MSCKKKSFKGLKSFVRRSFIMVINMIDFFVLDFFYSMDPSEMDCMISLVA